MIVVEALIEVRMMIVVEVRAVVVPIHPYAHGKHWSFGKIARGPTDPSLRAWEAHWYLRVIVPAVVLLSFAATAAHSTPQARRRPGGTWTGLNVGTRQNAPCSGAGASGT